MHDAGAVRGIQGIGTGDGDLDEHRDFHLPAAEPLLERLASSSSIAMNGGSVDRSRQPFEGPLIAGGRGEQASVPLEVPL